MCTHQERAHHYRAKADECLALSDLAASVDIREQYKDLAECYGNLALAEERMAAERAPAEPQAAPVP